MDNRSVVAYSPYLLLKFNCHMNVELCCTIKSVNYVYKYVYKGQTGVTISHFIDENGNEIPDNVPRPLGSTACVDEIQNFVNGRSVCVSEAIWHLMGFEMQSQHPHVEILSLHLPDHQQVLISEGKSVDDEGGDGGAGDNATRDFTHCLLQGQQGIQRRQGNGAGA